MNLSIIVTLDDIRVVEIKPDMTAKELIATMRSFEWYRLFQIIRDKMDRLVKVIPLEESAILSEFVKEQICMADENSKVTIFFNDYFRMLTGLPHHFIQLYIYLEMNVKQLVDMILWALSIKSNQDSFWLFANYKDCL